MKDLIVPKINQGFKAKIELPGSKSITIRDYVLASLVKGKSVISKPGTGNDCLRMRSALEDLGINFKDSKISGNDSLEIEGKGGVFTEGNKDIFLGGSGASTRFLMAVASLRKEKTVLDGDDTLRARPQKYLADALIELGAEIKSSNDGFLPIAIKGGNFKKNEINIKGDVSSQYFSALMCIAPLLPEGLTIKVDGDLVSKPYMDITIKEMNKFGVKILNKDYQEFKIEPQAYQAANVTVEGDASAASYFMALALILGGEMTIENLGKESVQGDLQFYEVCERLGVKVAIDSRKITIVGPTGGNLNALEEVDMEAIPDTAQTLIAIAPLIPGKIKITGLCTLRHKECDRIKAPANELKKLGVEVKEGDDYLIIGEKKDFSDVDFSSVSIDTYNDHRMAMSFAVLGAKIGNLKINNPDCVQKTFPDFWKTLIDITL